MTTRRTVDLLPEIFRTPTNRKFLSATLDQLTQEPEIERTRGYVGRRIGPGVNPADNYVREPDAVRSNYQLEPGVIFLKPDTNRAEDAMTYPGIIDSLDLLGADTQRQDRLLQSQYYTWDPFCDLDKFTNYSQYYWLPSGPDAVDISSSDVPLTDNFVVTGDRAVAISYDVDPYDTSPFSEELLSPTDSYSFSGVIGKNPTLTLARGGTYTFNVSQTGNPFWIQTAPGVNGRLPSRPNISSRDVLGVDNNGSEFGTVTFNVPLKTAQDFYYNLLDLGPVDLVTDLEFIDINNRYVDDFLADNPEGIDGITNLNDRTVIFLNRILSAEDGGWQVTSQFDPLPRNNAFNDDQGSFDTVPYDQTTDITSLEQRYSVWRIQYVTGGDGRPYMTLTSVLPVPQQSKLSVKFGDRYSNTQFWRTAEGFFEQIPLLSAIEDLLYYQDGTNAEIFGQIRLIDAGTVQAIDVDDIVGARDYTSPNGVVLTNGLKIQFRGPTNPVEFQDQEFYVEGVGTGPGIIDRVGFVDGEAYFGAWHLYQGRRMTGAVHDADTFQQYIYPTVAESLANIGSGGPDGAPLSLTSVPNATQGNGIRLVPVRELVTPEEYTRNLTTPYDSTPYDATPYDDSLDAPLIQDYITINRSSRDRNAWSRSNRWFHGDVIRYSAARNNTTPIIDNEARGKRPIIEFRANLGLYNFGTQGKLPVNIIDFSATDALSNINGTTGYGVDGYEFLEGSRVIFAADLDRDVRNRIYVVNFIDPDGDPNSPKIINLVPAQDGQALINQTVVVLSGLTQKGESFWFNGADWIRAQQKTNVNQAPLFDVYDQQGRSFSDTRFYPSTTFAGSRLFGYALGGTQITDTVLGFAVKYLNINNVGDIVFENFLYTDQFIYVKDNVGTTVDVSSGFVRQYIDRVTHSELIGWLPAVDESRSRQIFRFTNSTGLLILDVPVDTATIYPATQIFVDGRFIEPSDYSIAVRGSNTFITLLFPVPADAVIEASVLSNEASRAGFYQVPVNLENNPLNENSREFTLGTIRTHYETIGQNLRDIRGPIVGSNNTRDLGQISRYGQNIIQNSSPLTLTGVFLRDPEFDITQAIKFNSQEYEKYKARLVNAISQGDFVNLTPTQVLDTALQELSLGRDENAPFYWSDMIPAGETFTETRITYSVISTPTFDLRDTYDFTQSNFRGLLVYLNDNLLIRGLQYEVADGTPTVTITVPLAVGDSIIIREYPTTFGSFVPNTPTKMGLYPAYVPEIYVDTSYVNPRTVIRGHDGSITVAYNDSRDQVLLEFETRIYDNLKIASAIPLVAEDVIPGQWRSTDYTLSEINQILGEDFQSWIGWNKIDYTTQAYLADNEFTYNYSQSSDRIDGSTLLGAWRGIYQYLYDTTAPNTRPWEMLGFSQAPSWWLEIYGPAPYTSGNLVLWEDLAQGLVRDPAGSYVIPKYRRPGLLDAIPVGSEGELLSPLETIVGNYDANSFRRSWTFGDGGPAESAWRTSSSWPFAVMRLLALTKPAKFFSLFVDRDRYQFDPGLDQYLWNGRFRLDAKDIAPLYGDGVSRASYINWIIDYNRQLGVNSTLLLQRRLANLDVRLCWRTAAFTDKRFLKIFTERSTPTSLNASLLLPDESYALLLYQNPAFESFQYSSVIVQQTDQGYAVLGYSALEPYFSILSSRPNGLTQTIEAGDARVNVAIQHSDSVVRVPYGYVFRNRAAVCDFLISYGELLKRQGIVFEGMENGYIMNWYQMAQEFLYWSTQGWVPGSMINLNPSATRVSITRPNAVAESLSPPRIDNIILNQNRQAISPENLVIDRLDNTITLEVTSNETLNYFSLRFTAYEHMVVLDNRSIFADLIYDPITGARQSRVLVSGALTANWNGTVNAPGFVLNQDNIIEWSPNRVYTKGEIVLFKDEYWTASTIIQPSEDFNYVLWLRSDFDEVQRGLLPNASTVSDQLANAYSVFNANLENEVDLFSYGLIGFRPRRYMSALDLDDVSQVNLYQQFLGTKGTRGAAEIFSFADLGKETAEYDIYEYWAIQRGIYGANANRSYFEILLDPPRLTSDPNIIQIINPGQPSQADQTVLFSELWKTSYRVSGPDILPTVPNAITDRALPTAGFVDTDDVDFSVFDLDDITADQVRNTGIGTTIWVAADGPYEWNVYRAERVPATITEISDNLDGTSLVTFNGTHGLSVNDLVMIRFFSESINGSYRVRSVPSISTITIDYAFQGFQTVQTGTGLALQLQTSRVTQASAVVDLPYSRLLTPGSLVWVDNLPDGNWAVLEKTQPYQGAVPLQAQFPIEGSRFGASVGQGFFNLSALIGAPGYNPLELATAPGAVYGFIRNDQDVYQNNVVLSLATTGAAGYGNAIDIGDQEWAIAGASLSNSGQGYAVVIYRDPATTAFTQRRLLTAGDLEFDATGFGTSVSISKDERWIYIGAPGDALSQIGGAVYIYARVDVQAQSVTYVTDGTTQTYRFSDNIVINNFAANSWQFVVVLNNVLLTPGVDYAVGTTNITLLNPPLAGQNLIISRRTAAQLDQQVYRGVTQSSTTGVGSGATFLVNRVRGTYNVELESGGSGYVLSEQLTISAAAIGGGTSPANDLIITVTATEGGVITTFTQSGSGVSNTASFDLTQYFAQVNNIWGFSVRVDGVLQRPEQDYDYSTAGALQFIAVPPAGAVIELDAQSYFTFVDKVTLPVPAAGARFGYSVTTTTDGMNFIVGAPGADAATGRSYVFNRSVETYQVTVSGPATFTTEQSLIAPVSVSVNGESLINTELNIGGEFTVLSGTTVSVASDLQVGDIVEISTNHINLVQEIESAIAVSGAEFGYVVDQCVNDCSLYMAAPFDSTVRPQAGSVELWQNQARLYGTMTTPIANPTLVIGDFISINGFLVELTGTTVASLVDDINDAALPNVTASSTPDIEIVTDGFTRRFDVGSIYSSTEFTGSPVTVVLLDDVTQTAGVDYVYDNTNETITFTSPPVQNSVITVVSGRLVLTATDRAAAATFNKLNVQPVTGTVWTDLGIQTYVAQQLITSPVPQDLAYFGKSLFISDDTVTLAVGAPSGSLIRPTTFDSGDTFFDAGSTTFADALTQSGAVYTYDFLPAYEASIDNPGQFVFGQQIIPESVQSLDQFGAAVDLTTGILLMGAPGNDLDDSQANFGLVAQFVNANNSPSWSVKRVQTPSVDVNLLNTVYIYDYASSAAADYLDFFDPLQGRLLGAVQQNLDYIGAVDPASYNIGPVNNRGSRWAQEYVGQIWWDTTRVRFVDPNQGDLTYASNRWGQVFPGSQVEIYQWISSDVPPVTYDGPGQPRSTESYVVVPTVNDQGVFTDVYYFWVTGVTGVDTQSGKTLSIDTIARYIDNPRSSGIPYLAPLTSSTVALYNAQASIALGNAVLHVEFDRIQNDSVIHQEYQLVAQDRADGFLDAALYRKLLDSFCGVDSTGGLVPDPFLTPSERYGVSVRPRQSMFVNRFAALENYLNSANAVLARFPISETRSFRLLNSAEPEPSAASQEWNMRVANDQELSFQDLATVPVGYRYLVSDDARNRGLWSIYQVIAGDFPGSRSLLLIRVQNFDTRQYWTRIDWYQAGYDPATRILLEVPVFSSLETLTVPVGSSVKVTANGQGKWEIYQLQTSGWIRVALQDGTVRFSDSLWDYELRRYGFDVEVFDSQYFDQEPVIETRRVLEAINQELLIDDLLIERNRLLILMFNYILSEQLSPSWLTKTSLIDVDHTIRVLQPFQIYRQDNQDFVLEYINEVKPYHTQIREFGLIYRGSDIYLGNLTDFDVPAFWDASQNRFISPVLDNTGTLSSTSSTPSDSAIWQTFPWNQWFQNYLLSIESVTVIEGGSGYTVPPQVDVTGQSQRPAVMTARINSAGRVTAIDIIDPGAGYSTTATIILSGGNGSGAMAVAVMGNQLVRSITTVLRYDRYQYSSSITPWQAGRIYIDGDRVRYADRVWQASSGDSAGFTSQTFDPDQWTVVPAADLSGVDRTMGYYAPTASQPGLDLAQLMTGIDYPGVQVAAPDFNQNTGFDVGNYDINPFDNISFDADGTPTYDPAILDAIYESEFRDPFLGVLPAPAYAGDPPTTGPNPIIVDGGAFVDTYSSHAPEELVPGAIFDTLDLRVYTTPGADWLDQGQGFPILSRRYEFDTANPVLSFDGLMDLAVSVSVFNASSGTLLYPGTGYTVDWVNNTVTILTGASQSDTMTISVASLGGGNQLFARRYLGTEITDTLLIPRQFTLISDVVIFVNGSQINNFSYAAQGSYDTVIDFDSPGIADNDVVVVTVLGSEPTPVTSWSLPITQYITADGGLNYTLTNNLSGTNSVSLIVTVNGRRARPYNNAQYVSDGTTVTFDLPIPSDVPPGTVTDNDVAVFVNNVALVLGIGYVVDVWDGSSDRTVTLLTTPAEGAKILVSVRTGAQYRVTGTTLTLLPAAGLNPPAGSIMAVTTFNDTSEQDIFTKVFVGPSSQGVLISEAYDTTNFDIGSVTGDPGSFDYSAGIQILTNRFPTGRVIVSGDRILVSLDGEFLFQDFDYVTEGQDVIILGPAINPNSVVAITSFTNRTVPVAMAFRIFQDMRGLQRLYRITDATSTQLALPLSASGDTITVLDASRLDEPNLEQGIFGVITIGGERITYRTRNLSNNTLSGLRRGTSGTAAAAHAVGASVISMGLANLLPVQYQRRLIAQNFLGNGAETHFVADEITIQDLDSTELVEAVQVYVGGILQTSGYTIAATDPVRVEFETAPPAGYQVSIRIQQAQVMYQQGISTASDGVPLQETDTAAARFIRGQ